MESNRVIVGTIGLFIVICLVGAVLAPMINDWSNGESTTNEGAGWIRMEYLSEPDGSVQTTIGADGITVSRSGMDTQTGSDDTIIVATSTITVWWEDGHLLAMGQKFNGGDIISIEATTEMDVQLLNAGGASRCEITIDNDQDTMIRFETPTWAYLPKSTGNYGFFPNGTEVLKEDDKPLAAVGGGFAGVYANNAVARYGLPLTMQTSTTADGKIDGVTWVKAAAQQDQRSLTPITLDPDTREADLDPPAVRSVPTPTYSDGDWGYDLMTVGGVQKAKIVSYSGAGGGVIEVPATVGGYDVYQLGKGTTNSNVINTSTVATQLVIPEGIVVIADYAFYFCSNLGGELVIPSTVTTIGFQAFGVCKGFTGSLVLPSSVTSVGNLAFTNFEGITGAIVIPSSVTSIGNSPFQYSKNATSVIITSDATPGNTSTFTGCNAVTSVLDMSDTIDYSQNRYGLPEAATVQNNIGDALGYVSFTELSTDPLVPAGAAAVMLAIPVVILASLIVVAATVFIRRE